MEVNPGLFKGQFLLTKEKCDSLGWNSVPVADYHLYTHPDLELTHATKGDVELFLVGYFFDYRVPERTHQDIIGLLLGCTSFHDLLDELDELSGRAVLIYKTETELKVVHDAGGQREVFYDTTCSAVGSQPKLLEKVIKGEELTDPDAIEFYQSEAFHKFKNFVCGTTHRANIRQLLTNHFLDMRARSVHRFFPTVPIQPGKLNNVAQRAIEMLQGYIKAASLRYPVELGVTAGYDSRILFLASRDLTFDRYVNENNEPENPIDIKYAVQLGKAHGIPIEVRERDVPMTDEAREIHAASIDFPKYQQPGIRQAGKMIISGHFNEVTRNFFSNRKNLKSLKDVTGADLAKMYRSRESRFVVKLYDSWLEQNRALFEQTRYNYLDFFYWEERMGIWAAKQKTEGALNTEIYAPMCSRAWIRLLLSIDKKYRDKDRSKLHDMIIYKMSPAALKIPINPTKLIRRIRIMKKLGIFEFDQKYDIISKILRHSPFR